MTRKRTSGERAAIDFHEEPPKADAITDYDRQHFATYLRLLDAERDGADWEEAVHVIFGIDPEAEPERAHKVHSSHLQRALWMTENGYRHLLRSSLH